LGELAASDELLVAAAAVSRFYNEAVSWGLGLSLPDLVRWRRLMPAVRAFDPLASAVWIRKPPEGD
jgi:hypothetical protein